MMKTMKEQIKDIKNQVKICVYNKQGGKTRNKFCPNYLEHKPCDKQGLPIVIYRISLYDRMDVNLLTVKFNQMLILMLKKFNKS